jgi:hypothetical protein
MLRGAGRIGTVDQEPTYFQRMTGRLPQADRLSLIHTAFRLEWLTIAWMTVEAIVALPLE